MMSNPNTVSHKIRVADQSFNVRIRPEDQQHYEKLAQFVENVFSDIRDQGFVGGGAQVWAMAAFQIATELFETRSEDQNQAKAAEEAQDRIKRMLERIESVIEKE